MVAKVASEQFVRVIHELGAQICTCANASAAFGAPVEHGDRTVILVAYVVAGFGAVAGASMERQVKDKGRRRSGRRRFHRQLAKRVRIEW